MPGKRRKIWTGPFHFKWSDEEDFQEEILAWLARVRSASASNFDEVCAVLKEYKKRGREKDYDHQANTQHVVGDVQRILQSAEDPTLLHDFYGFVPMEFRPADSISKPAAAPVTKLL